MVDVDWLTLVFVAGTALLSGGLAFGAARSDIQALKAALERSEQATRREIDALRADNRHLQERLEVCQLHHSKPDTNHP